jgi:HAD superfamily hydrolase (TIGR01509 family)
MTLPASLSAVIFDLDGVLWDSTPIHARAYYQVLETENILEFSYSQYAGMTTKECLKQIFRLQGRDVSEAKLEELSSMKSRLALQALESHPPVLAGCRNLIETLRLKRRVALASSASPATVELFLKASGCGGLFSTVLNASSVNRHKPAPDIYLKACELLKADPSKVLVVEDAVAGIVAAKAAGTSVWAVDSTCPADALLAAGADHVMHSLNELL